MGISGNLLPPRKNFYFAVHQMVSTNHRLSQRPRSEPTKVTNRTLATIQNALRGKQMKTQNYHKVNYVQAIALLQDNQLIWSGDFDDVRKLIADVFVEHLQDDNFEFTTLNYLAEKLIESENDLTV